MTKKKRSSIANSDPQDSISTMNIDRIALARIAEDHETTCALCGGHFKTNSDFGAILVRDGTDVCWDCVNVIDPALVFLSDTFEELCRAACNYSNIENGEDPYYILHYEDIPPDLAYEALEVWDNDPDPDVVLN